MQIFLWSYFTWYTANYNWFAIGMVGTMDHGDHPQQL